MSIFHLKFPHMKHEENSIRGIRWAARQRKPDGTRKYTEIDLDMLKDAAGSIYGCHWSDPMVRDGFKDTALRNRMPRTKNIRSMTPQQVRRLVAFTRGRVYRIQRIERLLAECAKVGIGAVLEPKSPHFTRADWDHLAKVADDLGVHVRAYALPQNSASLVPAKRAGLNVKEIR